MTKYFFFLNYVLTLSKKWRTISIPANKCVGHFPTLQKVSVGHLPTLSVGQYPTLSVEQMKCPQKYRYYDVEKIIEGQSCNIVGMLWYVLL